VTDSHPCSGIKSFIELGDGTGTAGQPTEAEFAAIAQAGYQLVINLALPTSDGALPDEAAVASAHGMRHAAFPIDFAAPDVDSALRFFQLMDDNRDGRVFVHCAANMRVSALMFAYRVARLGWSREKAMPDLARIWQLNPTWARYVEDVIVAGGRKVTEPR